MSFRSEKKPQAVKTKIKDPALIRKRQRQICRGAMKVFRTRGFQAASIREIARASRLSLGSLYDYIEKKEDILFLVHQEILEQIYLCLDKGINKYDHPVDQLVSVLRELFYLSCRMKDEMLFIFTGTRSLDKKFLHQVLSKEAEFTGAIESLIKRGVSQGVFDCANPNVFSNILILSGAMVPLRGWNILPGHSEEEVVEELINFALRSLKVKERPGH